MDSKLSITTVEAPNLNIAGLHPHGINTFLIEYKKYEEVIKSTTSASSLELGTKPLKECLPEMILDYWIDNKEIDDTSDKSIMVKLREIAEQKPSLVLQPTLQEVFTPATIRSLDDIALPFEIRHLSLFANIARLIKVNNLKEISEIPRNKRILQQLIADNVRIQKCGARVARVLNNSDGALSDEEFRKLIKSYMEQQEEFNKVSLDVKRNSPSAQGV